MKLFLLLMTASFAASGADTRVVDAAKARNREQVRALLQQKAAPSETAADGTTALHWAAHWDDVEMAGLLLRSGANVQAANRYGVAPLVLACANGSDRMVDLLLKAKADPNTTAGDGETVLMTASRTGNAAAVKLLIAAGAKVVAAGAATALPAKTKAVPAAPIPLIVRVLPGLMTVVCCDPLFQS